MALNITENLHYDAVKVCICHGYLNLIKYLQEQHSIGILDDMGVRLAFIHDQVEILEWYSKGNCFLVADSIQLGDVTLENQRVIRWLFTKLSDELYKPSKVTVMVMVLKKSYKEMQEWLLKEELIPDIDLKLTSHFFNTPKLFKAIHEKLK